MPEYVHFHHELKEVQRVIQGLLVSRFHWTPEQILEMDDRWLDDVLTYVACDGIIQKENNKKKLQL